VCLFARWTFPSNWKYFKTILWERGSRTCKSTKLLTHDRTTYNMFVVHWPFNLLFEFGFGKMEMVVVYKWSSIPVYFWFVIHKIQFYQFCGFSYFVMMQGVYNDNVSISLQSIRFGHPSEKPYNPCTLMGWLDLQLEMMVNSMVLKHTSTQITCINNNLYF
jgi:hypothetical protein